MKRTVLSILSLTAALFAISCVTTDRNDEGVIRFSLTFGGTNADWATAVAPIADGYIIAGESASDSQGYSDILCMRLNREGGVVWEKRFGGKGPDGAIALAVQGDTVWLTGYRTPKAEQDFDVFLGKIDGDGTLIVDKVFGRPGPDVATDIIATEDGGALFVGYISYIRSTGFFSSEDFNIWIVRVDAEGNVLWKRTYGGEGFDMATSCIQTKEGDYVVAGNIADPGDEALSDMWVVRLKEGGELVWRQTFGEGIDLNANDIMQADDGTLIVTGYAREKGRERRHIHVKALESETGRQRFEKTYDRGTSDTAYCIIDDGAKGYMLAGRTVYLDDEMGDEVTSVLLMRIDREGTRKKTWRFGGIHKDYAHDIALTPDGGYIIAGYTESFGAGESDCYIIKTDRDVRTNAPASRD